MSKAPATGDPRSLAARCRQATMEAVDWCQSLSRIAAPSSRRATEASRRFGFQNTRAAMLLLCGNSAAGEERRPASGAQSKPAEIAVALRKAPNGLVSIRHTDRRSMGPKYAGWTTVDPKKSVVLQGTRRTAGSMRAAHARCPRRRRLKMRKRIVLLPPPQTKTYLHLYIPRRTSCGVRRQTALG